MSNAETMAHGTQLADLLPTNRPRGPLRSIAEKRVLKLFDSTNLELDDLTADEQAVLLESIGEKYIEGIANSYSSRIKGFLLGVFAPTEYLVVGALALSAMANSTTGAWFSISLKEMKAKFDRMGLKLTSNLLSADLEATSAAGYAAVGLGYKVMFWSSFIAGVTTGNPILIAKGLGGLALAGGGHALIEGVIRKKEDAAIQFDYNDATLAGMTEEQQKYFAAAVSDLEQGIGDLRKQTGVQLRRVIWGLHTSLVDAIEQVDIREEHSETITEMRDSLAGLELDYDADLSEFISAAVDALRGVTQVMDFDEAMTKSVETRLDILGKVGSDEDVAKPVLEDLVRSIVHFVSQKGEKGVKKFVVIGEDDVIDE